MSTKAKGDLAAAEHLASRPEFGCTWWPVLERVNHVHNNRQKFRVDRDISTTGTCSICRSVHVGPTVQFAVHAGIALVDSANALLLPAEQSM